MTTIFNNFISSNSIYNTKSNKFTDCNNNYSKKYGQNNLISNYLDGLAIQNKTRLDKDFGQPIYTSSGIENYKNMVVKDIDGNIVQEVKFSQEGTKITQTVKVNSVDGSTINKIITRDGNYKSMIMDIRDKNGNTILNESRTYNKINEDTAISTRNNEIYKISGLSGNTITVENNGEKQIIDFNKMVEEMTENIDQSPTGKNITEEQKNFLISRFKNRSGDILLTVAKEADKIVFLDGNDFEGWYKGYASEPAENRYNVQRKIKTCRQANELLELHELGHAINEFNDKSGQSWSSNNKDYNMIREKEIKDFHNLIKSPDLQSYMQKFTENNMGLNLGLNREECKLIGGDEEFAETFAFFNNMDLETSEFSSYRTTLLMRYMPESARMAYNASKNI